MFGEDDVLTQFWFQATALQVGGALLKVCLCLHEHVVTDFEFVEQVFKFGHLELEALSIVGFFVSEVVRQIGLFEDLWGEEPVLIAHEVVHQSRLSIFVNNREICGKHRVDNTAAEVTGNQSSGHVKVIDKCTRASLAYTQAVSLAAHWHRALFLHFLSDLLSLETNFV